MNNKITVISNQNLFDIAVQEYGDVMAVFDLALANGLSITDTINPGLVLIIPKSEFTNIDIRNYWYGKGLKIATDYLLPQEENEGISYWAININFIVS